MVSPERDVSIQESVIEQRPPGGGLSRPASLLARYFPGIGNTALLRVQ